LFFIDEAGNTGIGTSTPTAKLDVNGSLRFRDNVAFGLNKEIWSNIYYSGGYKYRETGYAYRTYMNGSGDLNLDNAPSGSADNVVGFTNRLCIKNDGSVGIGTSNPQNKLDVNGTIHAKEFKASLDGWSDYVFENGYKLLSLNEVEKYIEANKRLPDIPSAAEVKDDGVNLGEMNALLLKKVEELTLYVIELNKEISKLNPEKAGNIVK
jgi:hypothetical protein